MFKIRKKVQFSAEENKIGSIANTKKARELYLFIKIAKRKISP